MPPHPLHHRLSAHTQRLTLAGATMLCAAAQAQQATAPTGEPPSLDEVKIESHYDNALGSSDAASQGSIQAELIKNRPALRPGEVLEFVPGMVVTQHSGDGKANQYFLRGFNLDHGTDFATHVNGVPINMPTHAHGQGYSDLNLLIPELVERVDYRKGPYFASEGDFSAAGSAAIVYKTRLDAPFASVEAGSRGFRRALLAGGGELKAGGPRWLGALELMGNDGPWTVPEGLRKTNAVLTLADGNRANGWSASLMSYRARWTATDQIPERLVGQPDNGRVFGRFDSLDASDGGNTARTSLSGEWRRSEGHVSDKIAVYALHSSLDLFSNFTYFTKGPEGDRRFPL